MSDEVTKSIVETSPLWRLNGFLDFCLWRLFKVNSHVVTTEYRQAVECEARNPCIHDHNDIKNAEGTTEVFFCRAFSTLIFLQSYFAGIPHCVLHDLPIVCRPYMTFLQ